MKGTKAERKKYNQMYYAKNREKIIRQKKEYESRPEVKDRRRKSKNK